MRAIIVILFCFCPALFAQTWQVTHLKGKVIQRIKGESKGVTKGDNLSAGTQLATGGASLVRVKSESGQKITLAPNGQVILPKGEKATQKKSVIFLIKGALRYEGGPKKDDEPLVRTKSAALAVRGTDFMLKSNRLLGESEVVLFGGKVRFMDLSGSDYQDLRPGQWGGHGGRFGASIKPPIDLPENVLTYFKGLFSI